MYKANKKCPFQSTLKFEVRLVDFAVRSVTLEFSHKHFLEFMEDGRLVS